MKQEVSGKLFTQIKQLYENVEIYSGQYAELNSKEHGIIRAVDRIENPRVSDVARELGISMSTASWCIDKLDKKGFLKRHRSEDDRRAVFLTLTRKGQTIVTQFDGIFEKLAAAARENFSKAELENLADLLERLSIKR